MKTGFVQKVVVIYSSLSTCDPGDIHETISKLKTHKVRASVVGLGAEMVREIPYHHRKPPIFGRVVRSSSPGVGTPPHTHTHRGGGVTGARQSGQAWVFQGTPWNSNSRKFVALPLVLPRSSFPCLLVSLFFVFCFLLVSLTSSIHFKRVTYVTTFF